MLLTLFLALQAWAVCNLYQKMKWKKHEELGMRSTRFSDSSGLSDSNISSVMDLVKLAKYSLNKAQIKNLSNMPSAFIQAGGRSVFVKNTNKLVREEVFDAAINKTGYIANLAII
mgnify:CR=1 FL=1